MTAPRAGHDGMVGFLEEADGVRSIARLAVLLQSIGVLILCVALGIYLLGAKAFTGAGPDAGVIASFAAPLAPLAGGIWGALKQRAAAEAVPPPPGAPAHA